jgi:hypothetical protein
LPTEGQEGGGGHKSRSTDMKKNWKFLHFTPQTASMYLFCLCSFRTPSMLWPLQVTFVSPVHRQGRRKRKCLPARKKNTIILPPHLKHDQISQNILKINNAKFPDNVIETATGVVILDLFTL